jgi:hypothetical protein
MSLRQVPPGGTAAWLPDGRTVILGAAATTPGGVFPISRIAADGGGLAPRSSND